MAEFGSFGKKQSLAAQVICHIKVDGEKEMQNEINHYTVCIPTALKGLNGLFLIISEHRCTFQCICEDEMSSL